MKIPSDFAIKYTQFFINNEFVNSISGKTFPARNPSTGKIIAQIQEGSGEDIDTAVTAAKHAFDLDSKWHKMDHSARGTILFKFADLIEQYTETIAILNTLETGKPYVYSKSEVEYALQVVRYNAGLADKFHGMTIPADGTVFSYTRKEPVGVCGLIIPWNYPIDIFLNKTSTALAAGCTVVVKPAEQTSLGTLFIASLIKDAGFPPGVINIVTGYGQTVGQPISMHMDIDKISFTGSTEVGRLIMKHSGESNLKRVNLELGGKSPFIVFPDADLDIAVESAHQAIMDHSGQVCTAGSRTFVHEKIYEEFVLRSVERAKYRCVGDGFDDSSENGPQIDEENLKKVLSLIESGIQEGAKLECGSKRMDREGYYMEPTVFSNVQDNMRIYKEEIFGPVQCLIKFTDTKDVIRKANDTCYGLAACIFTKDINTMFQLAHSIRAGTVTVNSVAYGAPQIPFGGYKCSGIGRENGVEGLEEFLETKSVMIIQPEKY